MNSNILLNTILLFLMQVVGVLGSIAQNRENNVPDTLLYQNSLLTNSYQGKYFYLDSTEIEFIYIPPFEQVLDTALKYSPVLFMADAEIEKQKEIKRSESRRFLENLGFYGNANYGNYYFNDTRDFVDGVPPPIYPVSLNRQRTYWVVGVWARISIQDILGYKRAAISKQNIIIAENNRWQRQRDVREIVMTRYNDLLKAIAIYLELVDSQKSINIMGKIMNDEYINGEIRTREYMAYLDLKARVNSNAERAKAEIRISYLVLQEVTGMQLSFLKNDN